MILLPTKKEKIVLKCALSKGQSKADWPGTSIPHCVPSVLMQDFGNHYLGTCDIGFHNYETY